MALSTNGLHLDTTTVKQAMRNPGADSNAFKALLDAVMSTFSQTDRDEIAKAYRETVLGSEGETAEGSQENSIGSLAAEAGGESMAGGEAAGEDAGSGEGVTD